MTSFSTILLSLVIWMQASAFAESESRSSCLDPVQTSPALSFTISIWNPWDADRCSEQIDLAKNMGFTALTLVPSYGWDQATQKIVPNSKTTDGIIRCLNIAVDQGLEVHVKPHFEDFSCWNDPARNPTGACWRAWLDLRPGMEEDRWGHFLTPIHAWLEQQRKLGKSPRFWMMLGGEMERSLAQNADAWLAMANVIRSEWKVPVEINANWQAFCSVPEQQCSSLRDLVLQSERFTPSIYGDFYHHSVSEKVNSIAHEWAERLNCSHTREEHALNFALIEPKTTAGEMGVGPSIVESEEWLFEKFESLLKTGYFYTDLDEYLALRKAVYIDWLTWARGRKHSGVLNIWPSSQDPVGFSSGSVPDERLISVMRSYTQDRCGADYRYSLSVEQTIARSRSMFPENQEKKKGLAGFRGPSNPVMPPENFRHSEELKRGVMDQFCRR